METEDIPPSTLKPAPVIVACEIVTEAVPVFVRVRDWVLLEPVFTLPKAKFVALAASVPDEAVLDVLFAAGVPAPVNPVHPEMEKTARIAKKERNVVISLCWLKVRLWWARTGVLFMANTV